MPDEGTPRILDGLSFFLGRGVRVAVGVDQHGPRLGEGDFDHGKRLRLP